MLAIFLIGENAGKRKCNTSSAQNVLQIKYTSMFFPCLPKNILGIRYHFTNEANESPGIWSNFQIQVSLTPNYSITLTAQFCLLV
jgi:hypothetical protein